MFKLINIILSFSRQLFKFMDKIMTDNVHLSVKFSLILIKQLITNLLMSLICLKAKDMDFAFDILNTEFRSKNNTTCVTRFVRITIDMF